MLYQKCSNCSHKQIRRRPVCPQCGLPLGNDGGMSMDEYQALDAGLRRCIEKYKDAGFVLGRRRGDVFVMSHRSLIVGGSQRTRFIEYFGYILIATGTYYILDGVFSIALFNLALGAAIIYYDYRRKRVLIYMDETGSIVESGNALE